MKRLGAILCLSLIIALMATSVSFASGLTLVSSFPEEGNADLTPQNVAIKLVFSEKISDPVAIAANANLFSVVDAEGKSIAFEPLYNETKYPNEVWLQISETLTQNTAYKVTIGEGMRSSAGNTLEESIVLNFSTRNTEADSKGYMALMVVMIVGMMGFTIFDTKRKLKKESGEKEEEKKVNPYKEARRTGKSVEEIVARTEKEKAQAERRKAKVARRQSAHIKKEEPSRPGVKRVKKPRTISEKGYATPQSFIDARIAREQAKQKAKEKAKRPQSKSKGSKQQQRKKK
jgi:methionine-rich copper-binding protein CopC